jgi:hypothetical protein
MSQNTTSQPYKFCTEVTAFCPVSATTLGYYPNPGINYFFAIGFGLAMITTFFFGAWKRTWAYSSFITAGCALEMAGTLASNPRRTQLPKFYITNARVQGMHHEYHSTRTHGTRTPSRPRLWRSSSRPPSSASAST